MSVVHVRRFLPSLPLFLFALAFIGLPLVAIFLQSVLGEGGLTLSHYRSLLAPAYARAVANSVSLSVTTAVLGAVAGLLAAVALSGVGAPAVRRALTTLAAVAANFAGVPLAFAFMVILGLNGFLTRLAAASGLDLTSRFSLYSWTGLALVYLYFQIPLMVVLVLPAVQGLRKEWREAAATLGSSDLYFWRRVGLPILAPAVLGGAALLFANSFGAYATAFALVGARYSLLPIQISLAAAGNVGYEPGPASATAMVMVLVLAAATAVYLATQRRARRWLA